MRFVFFSVLALLVSSAVAQAPPKDRSPHSEASLVSEVLSVQPGAAFTVALRIQQEENWHSYWKNPGDAGLPTTIEWDLPNGVHAGDIQWTHPERLTLQGVSSYAYSGDLYLPIEVTVDPEFGEGELRLEALAEWLICEDICLPAEEDVSLTLPVRAQEPDVDPRWASAFEEARARLPVDVPGWRTEVSFDSDSLRLSIVGPTGEEIGPEEWAFFVSDKNVIDYAGEQRREIVGDSAVMSMPISRYFDAPPDSVRGVLVSEGGEGFEGHVALAVNAPVVGGDGEGTIVGTGTGVRGGQSLWLILGFAFLGGLLLNVMPCVFPVLSIKILGFADGRGSDRRQMMKHGLVFAFGVLVMFWILAAAVFILRAAGEEVGWGVQLQNPVVIAVLAGLMVAIGLNFLGAFEVGNRLMGLAGGMDQGNGTKGTFASGLLAVVVATPCTAPFMGAAMGFAFVQPVVVALLVFTFLAVGMALPYVLLASFPRWLDRLPKPGPWMQTFRQFLSFPMFLTAVWLVWVFGRQTGLDGAALLLGALVVFSLGVWFWGKATHALPRGRIAYRVLAALLVLVATSIAFMGTKKAPAAATTQSTGNWIPFDSAEIDRLTTEGTPVFVDFTAAWCLTCQVNKRTTLSTQRVADAFEEYGVVAMRADWTSRDPRITAELEQLERSGVPVYALYPADGGTPHLLPEFPLTTEMVLTSFEQNTTPTSP